MYGPSTNRHINGQHTEQTEMSLTDSVCTIRSKQYQRRYWKAEKNTKQLFKLVKKQSTAIIKTHYQMDTLKNMLKDLLTTQQNKNNTKTL